MVLDLLTYKLISLYMLKKVKFPLSNGQMWDFFFDEEQSNYFEFQQGISELENLEWIRTEIVRNKSLYELTKEGDEILALFENRISDDVKQKIDLFLEKNSLELRMENSILADYYKTTGNDYEVHCEVREGRRNLIDLKMSAATESVAEQMCENWQSKSKEIYEFLIRSLLE